MNRFRTKRKGKDKEEFTPPLTQVPTEESIASPFKLFSKSKKSLDESKPELDLENALPSQDDFRTSLLMTGLSARFSMLREQDDPNTKIGKASDDSVLPKRSSRGMDSMFGGLGDISEVESIRARQFSGYDGYRMSEDGGSVMNRAKPTEGNNVFGGRQKIYKISPSGTMGKALYEDDVSMSAFQRWRVEEKERLRREGALGQDHTSYEPLPAPVEVPEVRQPEPEPSTFIRKRPTEPSLTPSSTATSLTSPLSTSTTATSLASRIPRTASSRDSSRSRDTSPAAKPAASQSQSQAQSSIEKSVARTRRLYEQSLNQELQDHQSSSLSRMDTLARKFGPRVTEHPIGNMLIDRGVGPDRRLLAKSSAPNLQTRPISDSSMSGPLDGGKANELKPPYGAVPPLSPPISDAGEAKGFKSSHSQPYDESRFAQRQMQLKQSRDNLAQSDAGSALSSNRSESPLPGATDGVVRRIPPPGRVPGKLDPNRLTFLEADEPEGEKPRTLSFASTAPSRRSIIDHNDHPALRDSMSSTPSAPSAAPPAVPSAQISPVSEVTPGSAGLSGMVRAHLRSDSTASSVYEDASANESFTQMDALKTEPSNEGLGISGNNKQTNGRDEFANQLADRARIVREKLSSYVDGENSRPTSPSTRQDMNMNTASMGSKTSRGSLREHKSMKLLGLASPTRMTFDDSETVVPSPTADSRQSEDEGSMHPGLKQFRQARLEMQRQMQQGEPQSPNRTRNASRPPISFRNRDNDEPRTSSRASSDVERDRSNSDASNSSRTARLPLRSPSGYSNSGRPPVPPPQGMYSSRTNSPAGRGLSVNTQGRTSDGSTILSSPASASPMRLDESMRRRVSKKEISEPTFVSSTSRVPTVTLPESQSGSWPAAPSGHAHPDLRVQTSAAPPLPPINPRRRNVLGGLIASRKDDDSMISPHFPPTPMTPDYSQSSRNFGDEGRTMPGGPPNGMF